MKIQALAELIGGELRGDGDRVVRRLAALDEASESDVGVCFSSRFRPALRATNATAVLVTRAFVSDVPEGTPCVVVSDGRAALHRTLRCLHPQALRRVHPETARGPSHPTIHATAIVHKDARLGANVEVGPLVVIEAFATIGPGVRIGAQCFIGEDVHIGAGSTLAPRVVVLEGSELGDEVEVGSGTVIGSPGFGFDAQGRLPHPGRVVIERGVYIGANVCIDRATLGETRVGAGARIDNLVQLGHGVRVGAGAVLCGQVGLAGGAVVLAGAVIGGQAGVAGMCTVGEGARVAAQSGVTRSLAAGGTYSGHPAEENRLRLRRLAFVKRLVDRSQDGRRRDDRRRDDP